MRTKSLEKMEKILGYINKYFRKHGYSPSMREIAEFIGLSPSNAHEYIKEMSERKMLTYTGVSRGIVTSAMKKERPTRIPLLGEIACGKPLLAEENIECYITLSSPISCSADCFALRAKGNSMIKIGVADGDIVIVRKQSTADDGQVVVALVDREEATLKRFFRDEPNHRFRLHPENDEMDDMYYEDVQIIGVAIKVIKDIR